MNALDNHLFFPIVLPLLGGVTTILLRPRTTVARIIFLLLLMAYTGYSWWLLWRIVDAGRQVTIAASWPLPDGIVLIADGLSAIMLMLSALVLIGGWLFATATSKIAQSWEGGEYFILLCLLGSLSGIYLAGDGLSLVIWSEAVMMALFLLLLHQGEKSQLEASLKYLVIHIGGSILMLIGCAMLYRIAGTTSLALLAKAFGAIGGGEGEKTIVIASLFFMALIIRVALFPAFVWFPGTIHTAPIASSGILIGLLTAPACYTLFRLYPLLFAHDIPRVTPILITLAGLTIVSGLLIATVQGNIRRVMAFISIGQQGFVVLGIGDAGATALAPGLLLLIHTVLINTALLLIGGALGQLAGTANLKRMRGLLQHHPFRAGLLGIGLLAIAGFPPSGIFWGRVALLNIAILYQNYIAVGILVLGSFLVLLPLLHIWQHLFKPSSPYQSSPEQSDPDQPEHARHTTTEKTPAKGLGAAGMLIGVSLILTVWITPVFDYCLMTAIQVFDSSGYMNDVFEAVSLVVR